MSTTTPAPPPSSPPPSFKPLSLLSSPQSKIYATLHPILLGGGLYASFAGLSSDPISAGLSTIPATAAIQMLWCLLCLPAYHNPEKLNPGSSSTKATASSEKSPTPAGTPVKKIRQKVRFAGDREDMSMGYKITTVLLALLLTIVLAIPVLFTTLVLFGGSITTYLPHTFLLAAHLSLLAALPLFYTRGLDSATWTEIVGAHLPIDEVFGGTIASLIGCWIGAIVIPLDWDRDWQRWPVPILTGAFGGYIVGRSLGSLPFVKGSLLEMAEPEVEVEKKTQ